MSFPISTVLRNTPYVYARDPREILHQQGTEDEELFKTKNKKKQKKTSNNIIIVQKSFQIFVLNTDPPQDEDGEAL